MDVKVDDLVVLGITQTINDPEWRGREIKLKKLLAIAKKNHYVFQITGATNGGEVIARGVITDGYVYIKPEWLEEKINNINYNPLTKTQEEKYQRVIMITNPTHNDRGIETFYALTDEGSIWQHYNYSKSEGKVNPPTWQPVTPLIVPRSK